MVRLHTDVLISGNKAEVLNQEGEGRGGLGLAPEPQTYQL